MAVWKPITIEALNQHIELTSYLLTEEERSFWRFIRIEPEKWTYPNYGIETAEFFVVAIFGHRVIYYDDIEEGFNIAEYKEYSVLKGGGANQNDFHEYISHLFTFISSGKPWW